ncbi:MAG: hypothetical protein WBM78_16725, partial [Desulfobacterales bacterium]
MMEALSLTSIMLMRFIAKRGIAVLCSCAVTVAVAKADFSGETGVRETASREAASEIHLPADQPFTPWIHDPAVFEEDEGDRTEKGETIEQDAKTIKVDNLVPPIHFGLGEAEIPADYLERLREVLD